MYLSFCYRPAVKLIMQYLAYASDTGSSTWLDRLKSSGGVGSIFDRYEKEYPDLSESKLTKLIQSKYDEDAKTISCCIEDLSDGMKISSISVLSIPAGLPTSYNIPEWEDYQWYSGYIGFYIDKDEFNNGLIIMDRNVFSY